VALNIHHAGVTSASLPGQVTSALGLKKAQLTDWLEIPAFGSG
jgi:hypothetical protein